MDHNLKILISELKQINYNSYLLQTFSKKEDFANFCALFLLKATLNNIKNITSEEISAQIRFKWWEENLQQINQNKPVKNHHILRQIAKIHQINPKITEKLIKLTQNWQKDIEVNLNFTNFNQLEDFINQTYGQFYQTCLMLDQKQPKPDQNLIIFAQNLGFLDFFNNFFIAISQNNQNYAKYLPKDLFSTLQIPKNHQNKEKAEENLSKICQFFTQKCQQKLQNHPKTPKNLAKTTTLTKIILKKLESHNYNIKKANLTINTLDKIKLFF